MSSEKPKRTVLTRADLVLIVVLCLASLITLGFRFAQHGEGKYVLIEIADGQTERVRLDQSQVIDVPGMKGITRIEVTAEGTVRVIESACLGKHCVHAGEIGKPGQMIVCVPNGVCVSIESKDHDREVDAVVY